MQLDLFEHGRDVMLRNDVVVALRRRDPAATQNALAALSAEFPDDPMRASLTELSLELAPRHAPFSTHDEARHAQSRMENLVVPAAKHVFGPTEAHDWLVPVWRSMARAAAHLGFDQHRPGAHAAPMLLAAGDWTDAGTTIERIASWRRIPATLAWMAEVRYREAGLEAAWPLLAELAWSHPALFDELAGRLSDLRLRALLERFYADPELAEGGADLAWFPAWLLITEPSLLPAFRQTMKQRDTAPERCARIVMELLISERGGGRRLNLEQRKMLRALHPGLFERFMSTR